MGPVKSLWASVQNNPALMRRANGWLTIFWIVMTPVSYFMGWLDSVIYVSALSLWALVAGHWSAWQAARVEVKQEAEIRDAAQRDLPGEIVDRLVDETTLETESHHTPASNASTAQPSTSALARGLAGTPGCTCTCHTNPQPA